MRSLEEVSLSGKKVLLRIDCDVPLTNAHPPRVKDDFRLRNLLPTIHYLIEHQAKIILIGHLGRPNGQIIPGLSLRPVYLHLSKLLEKPIGFEAAIFTSKAFITIENLSSGELMGLENLRFDRGEDDNSRTFARKLAKLGDIYINEAFGTSHRTAASTVAITEFLPSYAGFSLEKEYRTLTSLLRHPVRPFVVIIGGAKIEDKLPIIRNLIDKVDWFLVGGGVANNFLAAKGIDVKQSLIKSDLLPLSRDILKRSRGKIILPLDFQWSGDKIYDLGPKTISKYQQLLASAKTVFWSGNLGKTEEPEFAKASQAIAEFLADSLSTSVIGGGNTVEFIHNVDLADKMSFVSAGGGATLELLAGSSLPGLRALD